VCAPSRIILDAYDIVRSRLQTLEVDRTNTTFMSSTSESNSDTPLRRVSPASFAFGEGEKSDWSPSIYVRVVRSPKVANSGSYRFVGDELALYTSQWRMFSYLGWWCRCDAGCNIWGRLSIWRYYIRARWIQDNSSCTGIAYRSYSEEYSPDGRSLSRKHEAEFKFEHLSLFLFPQLLVSSELLTNAHEMYSQASLNQY